MSVESTLQHGPSCRTERYREQRALIAWGVFLALAGLVTVYLLYLARVPLLLVYAAGLVALGLLPVVDWIAARHWKVAGRDWQPTRTFAIALIYVGLLAVVAGALAIVAPILVTQARELIDRAPALIERARAWLETRHIDTPESKELAARASDSTAAVAGRAMGAVSGVLGVVGGVLTMVVLSIYLLADALRLYGSLLRLLSPGQREHVREATGRIVRKVSSWLIGQMMVSAIIGVSSAIGLGLLGVPYFYVLALAAAAGELIPFVGPLLAAVPAIGIAATESWRLALWTGIFVLAQQQLENHVLVPKLMSRQVGLSAVAVLISVLVGAAWLGIAGAILAVPTAAIVQVAVSEWTERAEERALVVNEDASLTDATRDER